ncbi:MAG: ankyrin repeat domain-containing protein [Candidatus Babeliales bacterium]
MQKFLYVLIATLPYPTINAISLLEAVKSNELETNYFKTTPQEKIAQEINTGCTKFTFSSECPLYQAILNNNLRIAKTLLTHGANPNLTDQQGETVLFKLRGEQGPMAKLLIQHGAKVNAESHTRYTPLFMAVNWKNSSLLNVLLEYGAEVNHQLSDKTTALNSAIFYGNQEIVKALLQKGAKFNGFETIPAGKQGAIAFTTKFNKKLTPTIIAHYQTRRKTGRHNIDCAI